MCNESKEFTIKVTPHISIYWRMKLMRMVFTRNKLKKLYKELILENSETINSEWKEKFEKFVNLILSSSTLI